METISSPVDMIPMTGRRYTWHDNESLDELAKPARLADIRRRQCGDLQKANGTLAMILGDTDENEEQACLICAL